MTTIAPKPDWALAVWKDNQGHLFVQLGDSVLRFDLTDNALGKILKLIPAVEAQPGYVSGRQNVADHVLKKPIRVAKKTERERRLKSAPPERRSMIRELIRKSGIKESK